MESNIILDERIISLNLDFDTNLNTIEHLYQLLKNNGYVKESFLEAVLEREKSYATGLPLENMGVAIPHTDPEHVNNPAIAVAVLNNPVEFHMMGSDQVPVDVDIVFMLAITDPKDQITLLERLMGLFQNKELMSKLKNADTQNKVKELIETHLYVG